MSRNGITKVCHHLAERKKPVLGVALSSASLLALAVMLTPQSARAANECGAEGLGADTIICTGASYPTNGITYQNSDGLTLVLNNPSLVTDRAAGGLGGVYVSSTAGNTNDIVINALNFQSVSSVSNGSSGIGAINSGTAGNAIIRMDSGTVTSRSNGGSLLASISAGGTGNALVTLNGGQVSNTLTGLPAYGATAANLGTGNATIVMTGGSVSSTAGPGAALRALINNAASFGNASVTLSAGTVTANPGIGILSQSERGSAAITMTGGTVLVQSGTGLGLSAVVNNIAAITDAAITIGGSASISAPNIGARALNKGAGLARITMTGGTVSASGSGADGIFASNTGTGTYNISVTGGTLTGGSGAAAAIHADAIGGGIIAIGTGAVVNAGASGIALNATGGAAAITTAGALTGNVNLSTASNSFSITGGSIAGNIVGGGATAISFDLGTGNSFTYAAPYAISGVTGTAINSGTVIMAGSLTSPNVTIASGAVLQLGSTDTNGSISPGITDNGSFAFNRTDTVTFANVISGTGNVVQAGSGTTILTGANTYSGGTVLNAGILQVATDAVLGDTAGGLTFNGGTFENSAAFVSARSVTLTGNGAFQTDANLTLSGAISGNGALAKTGSGTLILTGTSNYSGGTTISAGTLQIGNGGVTGSITGNITDNTSLLINRTGSLSLAGTISGTGSISQIGSGSTTLSGVNSYSGGTTITAGTLIGSGTSFGSGAVLDNAALVISQPADGAMAIAINGTGSLVKQGSGRLNYTGTGTLTGSTTVAAGLLSVNGALASSPVTVQSGATLGGNGTVGATAIQSGGTIGPGNSIGTLHINGAFVQSSGSIYQVEVDPNTNASDLIAVTGTATLQSGAGLNVSKYVPGEYQLGTVYKVLTAGGGLSGSYALTGQTTGVSAFLGLKDSYDANNAYLTVVQTQPLTNVATTPNQQAVANAVQALPPVTNPATSASAPNPVQVAVLNLPDAPAARAAFDQLSGQTAASAQGALLANGLYVRDIAFDRLRDVMCAPASARRACDGKQLSIWGQGFGGWGGIAGNGNAAGLNHSSAGFLAGADVPVDDRRLGFFGGYSRSDFNIVSGGAVGGSNDYHLGAYGGTVLDNVALRLGASYTWSGITTSRAIAIGSFSDNLRGLYNGGTTQAFGELAYGIDVGGISLEPFANLTYVGLRTSAFTEAGGAAALTVRGNTTENMISTFGLRPSMDADLGGFAGTLRGMAGWRHTFGTVTPDAQISFAGGNVFGVTGAPIARDAGALEAGIDVNLDEAITIGLTYGGQFSDRTTDQSARGNFRISF